MKPGPRDRRHKLRISGNELRELKRHIYMMAEAFGLDRRIENYAGTRAITLYRWDLECLIDVIESALQDTSEYPGKMSSGYQPLKRLGQKLQREYHAVYAEDL